jgi:hypothetical protein
MFERTIARHLKHVPASVGTSWRAAKTLAPWMKTQAQGPG